MRMEITEAHDGIAVIKLSGALTKSSCLQILSTKIEDLIKHGRSGIIIELSGCRKLNASGLVALSELPALYPSAHIEFCCLPGFVSRKFSTFGLDRGLNISSSIQDALKGAGLRKLKLSQTKVFIHCGSDRNLFSRFPNPLLDVLGRSVLERNLDWLERFGVQNIYLNSTNAMTEINALLQKRPRYHQNVFSTRIISKFEEIHPGHFVGAFDILRAHQGFHGSFTDDFLFVKGDDFCAIDLGEMMNAHRSAGADITYADSKPLHMTNLNQLHHKQQIITAADLVKSVSKPETVPNSSKFSSGAMILSPKLFDLLPIEVRGLYDEELVSFVRQSGVKVQAFSARYLNLKVSSLSQYSEALRAAMNSQTRGLNAIGRQVKPGISIAANAEVSRQVALQDNCYLGDGATVEAGAELSGVTIVQANAHIAKNCVLNNCIVMPGTELEQGYWGQNQLIHKDGVLDLRSYSRGFPNHIMGVSADFPAPMHAIQKTA
ncbi:STAS domain-containing protein [Cognatishimia sp.]|uniref:STAS domain-containing protein n=1 Tax=Cognatishimia sp. TaxID=2211648 RepID=UPI003BA84E50